MSFKMKGFPMIGGTSPLQQKYDDFMSLTDTPGMIKGQNMRKPVWHGVKNFTTNTTSIKQTPKHILKQGNSEPRYGPNSMWFIGTSPGISQAHREGNYEAVNTAVDYHKNLWSGAATGGGVIKHGPSIFRILTSPTARKIYLGTAIVGTGVKIAENVSEGDKQNLATKITIPDYKKIKHDYKKLTGGRSVDKDLYGPITDLRMEHYNKKTLTKKQNKEFRAKNQKYDDLMADLNAVTHRIGGDTTKTFKYSIK